MFCFFYSISANSNQDKIINKEVCLRFKKSSNRDRTACWPRFQVTCNKLKLYHAKQNKRITCTQKHTARSLCTNFARSFNWSQSKYSMSKYESFEALLIGFSRWSSTVFEKIVTCWYDEFAFDLFCLVWTSAFLVSALVRDTMQSAAQTARREGNSNPSCSILQNQVICEL